MTNRKVFFSTWILVVAGLGSGCASTSVGWRPKGDTRGTVTVDDAAPRLLVVGPARLMHINWVGEQTLSVYTVAGQRGTDADCAETSHGPRVALRAGVSNHVDLDVGAGQAICVAMAGQPIAPIASQRPTRAFWHARQLPGADSPPAATATRLAKN